MKIAIDAGHGLHTAGKRCLKSLDPNQTREWVLNNRIASQVAKHLTRCHAVVIRLDDSTGETDVALDRRSGRANENGCDFCVSIHHNAGIRGGNGGGPVVYVYSGKHSAKADELQANVYEGLVDAVGAFGNRSNPLTASSLHMVRKTKMPAILVEVGFMDSKTDVPLILDETWAAKAAEGIARGIVKTAGLTWVEPFYLVRITANELNVRGGPGVKYTATARVKRGEVFTIVEERYNGETLWGKLKSGKGWVSLKYTEKV